jgi:hypothetical protein
MKRATKCPGCGVPVSVFAAGCAICGADLEAHPLEERRIDVRARRLARRLPRPNGRGQPGS